MIIEEEFSKELAGAAKELAAEQAKATKKCCQADGPISLSTWPFSHALDVKCYFSKC
jgi:hypothetical protein